MKYVIRNSSTGKRLMLWLGILRRISVIGQRKNIFDGNQYSLSFKSVQCNKRYKQLDQFETHQRSHVDLVKIIPKRQPKKQQGESGVEDDLTNKDDFN